MSRIFLVLLLGITCSVVSGQKYPLTPDKVYGRLFIDVQKSKIFADSKIFVDCIPLIPPAEIVSKYEIATKSKGFDLRSFVMQHFKLPTNPAEFSAHSKDIWQHIKDLWQVLRRAADTVNDNSSLLPLPNPYIVPGGRFREIYYWDSYFTMLGLKESGEYEMMENMVNNFAYLINQYGHIPNGNRTYYLSRSQPPFFSLMVELLAQVKGELIYQKYQRELYMEFSYYTNSCFKFHCTYKDESAIPRQESFFEDDSTAKEAVLAFRKVAFFTDTFIMRKASDSVYASVCNNLRSAAASGWDFSSRWMSGEELHTTETNQIVPIDLKCLLFNLEKISMVALQGKSKKSDGLPDDTMSLRSNYKDLLRREFYNEKIGWYCDYSIRDNKVMTNPTLAGMFPLFFRLADEKEVPRIVAFLKKNFLKDGGVVTSLKRTGQQWDAPNGWAPLQWVTIIGLENYGYHELAKEIATRWVNLNKKVFAETGKLMEKYDVVDTNQPAGGGEYPGQDGFGWTNGVLLALMDKYKL